MAQPAVKRYNDNVYACARRAYALYGITIGKHLEQWAHAATTITITYVRVLGGLMHFAWQRIVTPRAVGALNRLMITYVRSVLEPLRSLLRNGW